MRGLPRLNSRTFYNVTLARGRRLNYTRDLIVQKNPDPARWVGRVTRFRESVRLISSRQIPEFRDVPMDKRFICFSATLLSIFIFFAYSSMFVQCSGLPKMLSNINVITMANKPYVKPLFIVISITSVFHEVLT